MDRDKLLQGNLRTKNISEVLIERIMDGIFSGELKPGDKLPTEEMFAERVGVGRNSVHEAIKILEAFGVVEIRRADGTYIAESFHGKMLHPLIYGIVLNARNQADVAEFKIRIQEMIAIKLMEPGGERGLHEFQRKAQSYQAVQDSTVSEQLRFLEDLEKYLASLVDNPLLQELYLMTIQLSRYVQIKAVERKFETGNAFWFPEFFREVADVLISKDEKKARRLIQEEHRALLYTTNS